LPVNCVYFGYRAIQSGLIFRDDPYFGSLIT
jgi:hypothetical protein